ncbi:hypothetical protein C6P40_002169 [Pichia californica]|uniref:Uncharacterized protein n=1 Tax=Pichia californica TaxID=460514 RepID=A0A9P6WIJ1_9ASCO|nr:hypothetical protein C6P42_002170 [[Candida] californica]KAG0687581.1 hypothetical protein C6P40_002169 [[Candida] californica]
MSEAKKTQLSLTAVNHVRNYPFYIEIHNLLISITFIKLLFDQISNFASMLLSYISSFELIVFYWNYIDSFLNSLLDNLDSRVPILKTFSFKSLNKSIQNSYTSFISNINSRYESISKSLQPRIDSIYKFLDPILKLTNDYYEYILNLILPYSQTVSKEIDEGSKTIQNEYQRMLSLFKETYNRIYSTASNVSKIPTHVTNTYKNESKESTSTSQAVAKTTRKLSNDAYQSIKPTLDRVVGVTNSSLNEVSKVSEANIQKIEPVFSEIKDSITDTATGVEVH